MDRQPAEETARRLVAERFPDARAAWLSGSVVTGTATSTSDLDVTVVLQDVAVHRESLVHAGWPVELFVHTVASVRHFVAQDLARRRPSMARLVAAGVVLVDADGTAGDLTAECAAALAAGPEPVTGAQLDAMRYGLSDLLDDLVGGGDAAVVGAVAVATWQQAAELLLAVEGRWSGTGKWLVRELAAYDAESGSTYAARLQEGLTAAVSGTTELLLSVATEILGRAGGRLWAGYRADAVLE